MSRRMGVNSATPCRVVSLPEETSYAFSREDSVSDGAQQGIGKAIALAYGREGASVVINYLDNQAAAAEIASQIRALGQRAVPIAGDVAQAADIRRMVEAGESLGGIDILVNNAGIFPRVEFLDMTEDQWDEVLNVNLKGTFL